MGGGATTTASVGTMTAVTGRPHVIAGTPTAVIDAIGFVVARSSEARPTGIAIATIRYDTTRRHEGERPNHRGDRRPA
jgi:hypothetical protein